MGYYDDFCHLLNPFHTFNVFAVQTAVDEAYASVVKAVEHAKAAADPTFLAVPQGMPIEEAIKHGTRWSWHYDPAARAVAYLNHAFLKHLGPLRTAEPKEENIMESSISDYSVFIFHCNNRKSIKNFI